MAKKYRHKAQRVDVAEALALLLQWKRGKVALTKNNHRTLMKYARQRLAKARAGSRWRRIDRMARAARAS